MKKTRQWIVSGLAATALALSAWAGTQQFSTNAGPNQGKNETFYFTAPATCSIASVVGLNNPSQPTGGGGGTATVTLVNVQQVYTVYYGSNMTGSNSQSASGQAAGYYKIDHYATAGGPTGTGYATTTFTW